jgi:hypothetical protein
MQMPSYEVRNNKVFFGNQYLPDAIWSDFKDLGHGYGLSSYLLPFKFSKLSIVPILGKDGYHVFFMGQIIDNVDPFSFQMIDDTYARDHQHVFHNGHIVEGLQPHCFSSSTASNSESVIMQSISSIYPMPMDSVSTQMPSYEIRDFKVFFGNQYLSDARWIDFTDLGQGYGIFSLLSLKLFIISSLFFLGKDIHNVFFMGYIVEAAHPFSFEVIKNGYAKDKNHVFHNGRIAEGLKPFGFHVS